MNDMTPAMGHNNPPDPIELVTTEYADLIDEVQNWTDGETVTSEAQMKAVDALLKEWKTYRTKLANAGKERTDPLHKAWKAEVAAVKVYTDDADLIQKCLVDAVAPFKAKLAREKEEARIAAAREARKAQEEAERKAREAQAADLDAAREAAAALEAAKEATARAAAAQKDTVKGMRRVTKYEIKDHREALHDIAQNDGPAMTAFIEEYVRRNHKARAIKGVHVWTEKEAF